MADRNGSDFILSGQGLYLPRHLASQGGSQRADAAYNSAATQSPYDMGGLINAVSGLGTVNDKGSAARPNLYRQPLSDAELAVLYRYTARRLIDLVPNDCTRKGWQVDDPEIIGNPFASEEEALQIAERLRLAHVWARVFGGSRIWLVVHERSAVDLAAPLRPENVSEIKNLVVLTRDEYSPIDYDYDPESSNYRLPLHYRISPSVGGTAGEAVHYTRLLRFSGADLTATQLRANRGDGESLLECWWDALRNDQQIGASGAHLVQELSVFWIKLLKQAQKLSGGQQSSLLQRLAAVNVSKSVANAILLHSDEEVGEVARNLSGFRDVSDDAERRLARVTGYPMPVLSGESPSGLNTDGESHRKIWQNIISSEQKRHYRAPLRFLYRCLWYAAYDSEPDSWTLKFAPLDELTEQAQADLEQTHAETDAVRIDSGVISAKEARSRFSSTGYQNSLTLEEPLEEAEGADPAAEAEESPEAAQARADNASRIPEAMRREISYRIPLAAQRAARRVLRWRQRHRSEVSGMRETGWRRARQLARGGRISLADLIVVNAWFARHAGNEKIAPQHLARPWRDAGYVAWLGWGGPTMKRLAARAVQTALRSLDRGDALQESLIFLVPLPEAAEQARQRALAAVQALLPDLEEPTHEPHVTLLYLGKVASARLLEVAGQAEEVLASASPLTLQGGRVGYFEPSPSSDQKIPVIIEYRSRGLQAMNAALLRSLAPDIAAPQFATYRPHITLGYLPRALSEEEEEALAEITAPGRWRVEEIRLCAGKQALGLPYRLRRSDEEGYQQDAAPGTKSARPAPAKEQIKGSRKNRPGSAGSSRGGIKISEAQEKILRGYLEELPEGKRKGVDLGTLKAVYRRGAGAYSSSHDPRMSRVQWSLARVKAFLRLLKTGKPRNPNYTSDYDLLPSWHGKSTREDASPGRAARLRAWRAWIKETHAPAEERLEQAAEGYLEAAAARYVRRVEEGELREGLAEEGERFLEAIRASWLESYEASAQEAAEGLSISADLSAGDSPEVAAHLAALAEGVTEHTLEILQPLLSEAEGLSPAALREAVLTSSAFDNDRALRIATTEATAATNQGRLAAYREAGRQGIKVEKVWITAGDGFVRQSHRDMDGQRRALDAEFISGLGNKTDRPGGFGIGGEDINCRCMVIAERS